MKRAEVKPGMVVTVCTPIEGQSLWRNGRWECKSRLIPGQEAVVEDTEIPKVRIVKGSGKDGLDVFVRLSWVSNSILGEKDTGAANYCNIRKLK